MDVFIAIVYLLINIILDVFALSSFAAVIMYISPLWAQ